jgi:glycosyltransferase involved in cell wall biosynthesis
MMLVGAVWMFAAMSVGGGMYWLIVRWRVHRDRSGRPFMRSGIDLHLDSWPTVSVIIPAHNEEQHAPELLRSLVAQSYPAFLEVIFVLDRCTDASRAALEREWARHPDASRRGVAFRIIENESCPEDWAGKCNAAAVGAAAATGERLLFTDADTLFDPLLVRASAALLEDRGLSLLSALPGVSIRHLFEATVQPMAAMELMKLFPIARANDAAHPRPFANGQFMLFTREGYDAIGGHAAVKDDLLEDLAFARAVVQVARLRAGLFIADDMLHVRMYETYRQFRHGWRRIFIEAARRRPHKLQRYAAECVFAGAGVFIAAWLSIGLGVYGLRIGDAPLGWAGIGCGAFALFVQQATLMHIFALIGVPRIAALTCAHGSVAVAGIMWQAARDLVSGKPVRWGGRDYVLTPVRD